jgi:hypothetical protein
MGNEDTSKLQARLTRALEDSDMLRSRLRMELQEKQALEMKVSELTDKLVEAKRGLQETSLALHKVQMATNQLMAKRDQRELQLQACIDQNHLYEKKISELENHISRMNEISDAKTGAHTHSEKLITDQLEKLHQLEEESGILKGQVNTLRRENVRLTDEKTDLEYVLESKKKRIGVLEEHIKTDANDPLGLISRINTASRTPRPIANGANGNTNSDTIPELSTPSLDMEGLNKRINDISSMEGKLNVLVTDKKSLEDRLKQLEDNLTLQSTAHQKQMAQQQQFYQSQLQNQQQHIQQLQFQAYAAQNLPMNGISLPLDQIPTTNGGMPMRGPSRGNGMPGSANGNPSDQPQRRPNSQQQRMPAGGPDFPSMQQQQSPPPLSQQPSDNRKSFRRKEGDAAPSGGGGGNRDQQQQKEREQRDREQRERDQREQQQREKDKEREREREREQREGKERDQREREKERDREQRDRDQKDRDRREQKEREQREKEKEREREREQNEREQNEREQQRERERERENKEREREQRGREQKEREQQQQRERDRERERAQAAERPRSQQNRAVTPNATTVTYSMGLGGAERNRERSAGGDRPIEATVSCMWIFYLFFSL